MIPGPYPQQTNVLLEGFRPGDRVVLAPTLDRAQRGDGAGVVVKTGRFYVTVRLERSGDVRKFAPEHLEVVR